MSLLFLTGVPAKLYGEIQLQSGSGVSDLMGYVHPRSKGVSRQISSVDAMEARHAQTYLREEVPFKNVQTLLLQNASQKARINAFTVYSNFK